MALIAKNRKAYLEYFREEDIELPCPYCDGGLLKIDKETFRTESTKDARFVLEHFDVPELSGFKFVSILTCKSCEDTASMAGVATLIGYHGSCGIDECMNSDHMDEEIHTHFHYEIKYIDPPINIIQVIEDIPQGMYEALIDSFALFWLDQGSAGNKIRIAIELFMDEVKISKTFVNKKGETRDMFLGKRIEKFGEIEDKKYEKLSRLLTSVKWLGNEGSHVGDLEKEDLLDAYEVLEHVFDEFFMKEKKAQEIKEKAEGLEKKYKKIIE